MRHDLHTADGLGLHARLWDVSAPRGQVLLVHGLGEHVGRYEALAGALNSQNLAIGNASGSGQTKVDAKNIKQDQVGALNLLTPAMTLNAAKLIKTGKTYSLGITVNTTTPAYPPRTCSIFSKEAHSAASSSACFSIRTRSLYRSKCGEV